MTPEELRQHCLDQHELDPKSRMKPDRLADWHEVDHTVIRTHLHDPDDATMTVHWGAVSETKPLDFDEVEQITSDMADRAEQQGIQGWDIAAYLQTEGRASKTPQVVGTIIRVYVVDPAKAVAEAMKLVPKFDNAANGGTLKVQCSPIGDLFYEED